MVRWSDFESQTFSIHEEIFFTKQQMPGGDDQHVYESRNMLKSDVEQIRAFLDSSSKSTCLLSSMIHW